MYAVNKVITARRLQSALARSLMGFMIIFGFSKWNLMIRWCNKRVDWDRVKS